MEVLRWISVLASCWLFLDALEELLLLGLATLLVVVVHGLLRLSKLGLVLGHSSLVAFPRLLPLSLLLVKVALLSLPSRLNPQTRVVLVVMRLVSERHRLVDMYHASCTSAHVNYVLLLQH